MKHYSIENWADFIRGLVTESERTEMVHHLASPCPECQRSLGQMQAVQSTMLAEVVVPEHFLARARAIFPRAAKPEKIPAKSLVALLTFDSLHSPIPAGARSIGTSARRLAFAVDDFKIELLVETAPPAHRTVLTGQVTSTSAIGSIRLMSRKTLIQEALPTALGEFEMEFQARPNMHLKVSVPELHKSVEVPLDLQLRPAKRTNKNRTIPPPGESETL